MKRSIILVVTLAMIFAMIPSQVSAASIGSVTVKNLKLTDKTYNSITLSWGKVNGASGYQVYKSTSKDGTYSKIKTTSSTRYKRTNLTTNTTVYYKVRAYAKVKNKYVYGKFSSKVAATPEFKKPVLRVASADKTATLSWDAVEGAQNYLIYRATSKAGTYSKVKTVSSSTKSWKNSSLTNGKTYYYKIRATRVVSEKTKYSSYSDVKSVTINKSGSSEETKPETPVSSAEVVPEGITVTWKAVEGASGYEVSRGTSETGEFTVVADVSSARYVDTDVDYNVTYHYKVRAYVMSGNKKIYSDSPKGSMGKSRADVVGLAKEWLDVREDSSEHHKIVDIFNANKPASMWKMRYSDPWCATYVSAVAVKAKTTSFMPMECGCERMIKLYMKINSWVENDAYKPEGGDVIFYDWKDGNNYATTDNKTESHHVGIVTERNGENITVIEGNTTIKDSKGNPILNSKKQKMEGVSYRTVKVNGRYIRGFAVPKYPESTSATYSAAAKLQDVDENSIVIEAGNKALEIEPSENMVKGFQVKLNTIQSKTENISSEYNKAKEILTYINKNMPAQADVENKSAYYSRLVFDICNEEGIAATLETSEINGALYSWNILTLDGKTYFVDLSAGTILKECVLEASDKTQ